MPRRYRHDRYSYSSPSMNASYTSGFWRGSTGEAMPRGITNNYTQVFADPQQMLEVVQQAMSAAMMQHGMNELQLGHAYGNGLEQSLDHNDFDSLGRRPRSSSGSSGSSESSDSSADGFGNRRSGRRGRRDTRTRDPHNSYKHDAANFYAWLQEMSGGYPR